MGLSNAINPSFLLTIVIMSASDSEFDDSDYDSFISSLGDDELDSVTVASPSTKGLSLSEAGQPEGRHTKQAPLVNLIFSR